MLEVEVQLGQLLKDTFGAFSVNFFIREENKEIVHIKIYKPSLSYHIMKRVVHESLEHCRGVGKAK